ncbi:MAG: hypothetical protein CSA52_02300 [Gammaproteobacteria bacterium]|nr:MAG: hypothetical protein CSB48_06285 [Pseudomonadota bacterium]PIE38421.1 MAG: hypothetical protein CSA52_02300 [Gammaproteobacteria bacterium]
MNFIEESRAIDRWISHKVKQLAFPQTCRNRVSVGLLHYSLELQTAFFLLVENRLIGSAYALMRPIYESYVRACWLHLVATDEDLEHFKKDNAYRIKNPATGKWNNRSFDQIIQDLEQIDNRFVDTIATIKQKNWKVMNSLIHGGAEQIYRRISGETIQGVQAEADELRRVSGFVSSIALLSALELAKIAENNSFAKEVVERLTRRSETGE